MKYFGKEHLKHYVINSARNEMAHPTHVEQISKGVLGE